LKKRAVPGSTSPFRNEVGISLFGGHRPRAVPRREVAVGPKAALRRPASRRADKLTEDLTWSAKPERFVATRRVFVAGEHGLRIEVYGLP
jgi:hypothetical protein